MRRLGCHITPASQISPSVSNDSWRGVDLSVMNRPLASRTGTPLICYEDTFPGLARDSVRSGADVLVVLTNNGWLGEGGAAYQHAAHSVLRATSKASAG